MKRKSFIASAKVAVLGAATLIAANSFAAQGPQPSICTRSCWGARAPQCAITYMGALSRAIIHHTAGAGDYTTDYETAKAKVRGIQNYHMDANGWCDIAYHFLVDAGGHIFEGRSGSMASLPRGAHDSINDNSFGFNIMGYFHTPYNQTPTTKQRSSLYDVMAWRMPSSWSPYGSGSYGGGTVGVVDSHRAVTGSACPGDKMIVYITSNYSGGEARDEVDARKNGTAGNGLKDRVHVFGRGGDGACWLRTWDGDWNNWYSLGGNITGGPDAYSRNEDHVAVVVNSATEPGHIKQLVWNASSGWGAWSDLWTSAGGNMTSDPTSCARGTDNVHIFARGSDGACWKRSWNANTGWAAWASEGGNIIGAPDCCSKSASHLYVAVHSATDPGHIKGKTWTAAGGWGGWVDIWTAVGGNMDSDPSVVARGDTKMHVFARKGTDVWIRTNTEGSGWAEWYSLGNPGSNIVGSPDSYSRGSSHVAVVVRNQYNNCWKKTWTSDSGWGAWEALDQPTGGLTSSPGSTAR